jgi:hypothetical protein
LAAEWLTAVSGIDKVEIEDGWCDKGTDEALAGPISVKVPPISGRTMSS